MSCVSETGDLHTPADITMRKQPTKACENTRIY